MIRFVNRVLLNITINYMTYIYIKDKQLFREYFGGTNGRE